MKKLNTLISRISWSRFFAGLAVMLAVFVMTGFAGLAAEGKVKANTNIRSQTSTDSEKVGSAMKGKVIDILEAVKDSSGTVWYKVSVENGGYGYIRSDLVETTADIPVSANASSEQPALDEGGASETEPSSIGERQAVVSSRNSNSANVRSGASTKHSTVTSLPNGTQITLIGEADDGSGSKWYQITCNYNDKTIEGYIRSDLVEITESQEGSGEEGEGGGEGENPEGEEGSGGEGEQQPESDEEHNDYEVVYKLNENTGESEYYLYNNIEGTQTRLIEILNLVNVANENTRKLQDQVDKEKIVIIILAVVIVLLFIVLTVLLFKIRDLYYGEYEEEEEEEEPEPVRKKPRKREAEEEEEAPAPVKRKRSAPEAEERPAKARGEKSGQARTKADREKELYAAEKKEPVKKSAPRKSQNFLVDDDEFEFEFLNMDDKDL